MKKSRKDVIGSMENLKKNKELIISLLPMFIIELVVLVGFNLANQNPLFRILAFVVMCATVFVLFKKYDKKTYILMGVSLAFLMLFIVPSFVSRLTSQLNLLTRISILIGVIPFFVFGVFLGLSNSKEKMIHYLILAIYGTIGLYTLVSLGITMYDYGTPLYYLIYSKDGALNNIIDYASSLIGFEKGTVRIESLTNFGLLASTALGITAFSDKNKDKKTFYISLVVGLIGVITMILLPVAITLYLFVTYCLVIAAIKYWKHPKFKKKAFFASVFSILGALMLLRVVYHLSDGFAQMLDKTYVLKEMIVPRLDISARFEGIITSIKNISLLGNNGYEETGVMLFDVLQTDGVFAFLGLLGFFGLSIYALIRFIKENDSKNKLGIATLVITLLVIFFFNDYRILTTYATRPLIVKFYYPISLDILFMFFLVLIGYMTFYKKEVINQDLDQVELGKEIS